MERIESTVFDDQQSRGMMDTDLSFNNNHSVNFAVAGQVVVAYGDTIAPFLIAGDMSQGFPV